MTYLIAAAGTGGHVFPGLAVGEALVDLGVSRNDVLYVGGDRLEASVYPREGFKFLQVELAGLKRSVSIENLRLPGIVRRARRRIAAEIGAAGVRVVLGMGGYVTIPAGLAARSRKVAFFNSEQNAEAGLANRVTARWARTSFVSFPQTGGLPSGQWVGNPVRAMFWSFDRSSLVHGAREYFDLSADVPVVGVFGGSLGAVVINEAVVAMVERWSGPGVQMLHLTGKTHLEAIEDRSPAEGVLWRRIGFEDRMDHFYAACDLVICRAGGAVAEVTATGTASVLVPGRFGSSGHQAANARFLRDAGAAEVVEEEDLGSLGDVVAQLISDEGRRAAMTAAAGDVAKPDAARTIARTMIEVATA